MYLNRHVFIFGQKNHQITLPAQGEVKGWVRFILTKNSAVLSVGSSRNAVFRLNGSYGKYTYFTGQINYFKTDLHGSSAGSRVGSRQLWRSALGSAAPGQQVVEQRWRPRADERVERRHREHAELVQRALCTPGHVCQQRLRQTSPLVSRLISEYAVAKG